MVVSSVFDFHSVVLLLVVWCWLLQGPSEALRLLQEAGLRGQRHKGWGEALEAHPRMEVEVRGGQ